MSYVKRKIVLSIAGSDSSGGAGVQADIKAFSYSGVHGMTIITCLTTQTPDGVVSVHPLQSGIVSRQTINALKSFYPDVIKIGMLCNEDIGESVLNAIDRENIGKVVVDPIFKASDGTSLFYGNYREFYIKKMLPISYLITPNIEEAEELSGISIMDEKSIRNVGKRLVEYGAKNVLIKGFHLNKEQSVDYLYSSKSLRKFYIPEIKGKRWHGTGCTFSSLIASNLALGRSLESSINISKRMLWSMMDNSYKIRKYKTEILIPSNNPIDFPPLDFDLDRLNIWVSMRRVVKRILKTIPLDYIPEVGVNIGYALPNAEDYNDICAVDGRIVRGSRNLHAGPLKFGASKHISSIILAVMNFKKEMRSAMNITYSKEILEKIRKAGLLAYTFDRKEEPVNSGSTMEWGTREVIKKHNKIPDVIWDKGSIGKEPMIRILGINPDDIFEKLKQILNQ